MPLHRVLPFALLAFSVCFAHAKDEINEASFLSNARQLTFEGKRSGEGYFHPDGNLLVFQSERDEANPFYQIFLLDLLSGESARVSPGQGKTTCAFFQPGSGRLLFASTHHDPNAVAQQKAELEFRASGKERRYSWDYDPNYEIFAANQDGTQLEKLTDSVGYDAEGAYSPDGKQIVFCSTRSAYPLEKLPAEQRARFEKDPAFYGEIYLMNADGSNVRRLTETPGYDGGPFFSPDGQRIVWRRFDEHGMIADVWTMKLDGSDKQRVTAFGAMSWAPYYHPSGQYIIFTSNKLGFENFELFIADAEGKRQPVRVSYTDGFDGLPVFSPDGKRLCWTSNRTADHKSQLFMANWDHAAALSALEAAPPRTAAAQPAAPIEKPERPVTTAAPLPTDAPFETAISKDDLQRQIAWMAHPDRGGRMTGSAGAQSTADWLADYLKAAGLEPVNGSFFDTFKFNAGERLIPEKNSLRTTIIPSGAAPVVQEWKLDHDFRPLSFSESAGAEGEVVFAGYGLSVPEGNGGLRYNSYDGLDVKDKIVLILRYVPEAVDPQRRAQLNRYAGLRYKAMLARERGAKAVLFVTGPSSPHASELIPLSGDNTLSGSGIIAHSITGAVADALLKPTGKSLKDLQSGLDTENPHAEGGFPIPGVKVVLSAGVEHITKEDRNVIAAIPPGPGGTDEWIVIGAHYDHLGAGRGGNSMARSGEEEKVHLGADDNASGVAAIMELAAVMANEKQKDPAKFRRGVLFAAWSGEEIGIIGSSSFVEEPPIEPSKIAAYINFDMVGRLRENKLSLQAVGSSKLWRKLIEKRNVAAGFNLVLQDDPYLPTDVTAFYPKRVPVLNFFTGAHEDYHRPTDTADKINYDGMQRITDFAHRLITDVVQAAERPDFARVEKKDQGGGSRDSLRAYLGTIPDYTTDAQGVKISGVRVGSPAEKAGLKGGDVIVEFAGQKIVNIYDYTYALDAAKIGQAIPVVVLRDGKRTELSVTPEARK
ncbi:MAG: M28 family peptidase [Chthoniobacteraceae bacterium]